VVYAGRDGIAVGTGARVLWLRELQVPGRPRIGGAEFVRGFRVRLGEIFEGGRSILE
jgi:hypothetical protein